MDPQAAFLADWFLPRLRKLPATPVDAPRRPRRICPSIRPVLRIGNNKASRVFSNHSIILYDTCMRIVPAAWLGPLRMILLAALAVAAQGARTLDIYFIDVEGGQSTLVVPPSGQALLIDTGYAGNSGRDANRIAAAAKAAGVKKIDTLLITHFHGDHVGGVSNLLERLPVATFLDYGPSVEGGGKYPAPYEKAIAGGAHRMIAPGDKIAIKGLDITVLTAASRHLQRKGDPNPYCAGLTRVEGETGENPQSAAVLIQFGSFRFVDPGDIVWNEELALECPDNKVGKVDLYLTAHHATHVSPKSVYGLAPRVIVMDNGARKGGLPDAWKLLHNTPGLEDIWQLHFSFTGGKQHNAGDPFIANLEEHDEGMYLKVSASEDGAFTVFNQRNKYTKAYPAK
jgi:competence protein ComEC